MEKWMKKMMIRVQFKFLIFHLMLSKNHFPPGGGGNDFKTKYTPLDYFSQDLFMYTVRR